MIFNRKHVPETFEQHFGFNDYEDLYRNRRKLESISLDENSIKNIRLAADKDITHFYFKALLSLFEAIDSISKGRYSWATVKIYYSVYYFLHTEILARGTILLRAGGFYRVTLKPGEHFITKKNKEYNSDHSGTIMHFIDMYSKSDPLLTNKIDGMDSYIWLLKKRERINYQERYFNEPSCPDFWSGVMKIGTDKKTLNNTVKTYLNDKSMIYTFQDDHAILSLPIKCLQKTTDIMMKYGYKNIVAADKKKFLKKILICNSLESYINL